MAGQSFSNPNQLQKYLSQVIEKVMLNEVTEEVIDIWLEHQQEIVYKAYEPRKYVRRRTDGGLADPTNIYPDIQKKVNGDMQIILENLTEAKDDVGKLLNALIEGSDGYAGNPSEGKPARPYTSETYQFIISNPQRIRAAIIAGFAKHGIKVNVK